MCVRVLCVCACVCVCVCVCVCMCVCACIHVCSCVHCTAIPCYISIILHHNLIPYNTKLSTLLLYKSLHVQCMYMYSKNAACTV